MSVLRVAGYDAAADTARKKLTQLEERMPWVVHGVACVKKAWTHRRAAWVDDVAATLNVHSLVRSLLLFESMLTQQTLGPSWSAATPGATSQKLAWRARLAACAEAAELEAGVAELHGVIMWSRILVAPDGRPLTQEEIESGAFGIGGSSTPMPPPLPRVADGAVPSEPPEGLPRGAARAMLLLQSMGVHQYDPKVAVQLVDLMHGWTASVLRDAGEFSRVRALGLTGQPALRQQLATQFDPPILLPDLELAVKTRAGHSFKPQAPRELLSQQATETNLEPMPLLPKRQAVVLPIELSHVAPEGRRFVARGLDTMDDDASDGEAAGATADLDRLRKGGVQTMTAAVKREHALLSMGAVGPCSSAAGFAAGKGGGGGGATCSAAGPSGAAGGLIGWKEPTLRLH